MQTTRKHRSLLVISGLIAVAIGSSILISPAQFHATHGIELGSDANLLSEVRAPGGALLLLGLMIGVGGVLPVYSIASTSIAAAVYLGYGLSRVLSLALDGVPVPGLVGAMIIELAIGAMCIVALVRATPRSVNQSAPPPLSTLREGVA